MPTLREIFYEGCLGKIDLRAIKGTQVKQAFFMLDDDKGINSFIHKHINTHDLYFGVATRDSGGGKKENIKDIPALWVDLDYKNISPDEATKRTENFIHRPTVIVESGGGLHLYWLLKEPCGKVEIPQCEAIMRGMVSVLGGDRSATDASRVLRIPSTLNHKYSPPRKTVLRYHNGSRYNLSDFDDFMATGDNPSSYSPTENSNIEAIMSCRFMQYCHENREALSEPCWYAMITNLMKEKGGIAKIHELSMDYPFYDRKETDAKILHAMNSTGPMSCNSIRDKTGFVCDQNCDVYSPAGLAFRQTIYTPETFATNETNATQTTGCNKLQQTSQNLQQTAKSATNSANYLEIFKVWLETCDGEFKMQDAAKELGWYKNPSHYTAFRSIVHRAVQSGLIAKVGKIRGIYRTIKKEYLKANLKDVVCEEFPLVIPFGLHHLVEINPKEIILVAGETNSGKTAFIYNLIWQNILHYRSVGVLNPSDKEEPGKLGIRYFSSEMGPAAIKKKILDFGPAYPFELFDSNVTTICDRSTGFQDILDSTGLNCVDYIEPPNGDYYMMAPTITEYFSRLTTGVAVIAIQKKSYTEFARGGEATLEKPRLAISLIYNKDKNYHTARIVKAKAPRDKSKNLYGMEIDFCVSGGTNLIELNTWGYPSQHEKQRKTMNFRGDGDA